MEETHGISSDALAAYVAGEADAMQRAAVEQWAASDPANAAELERMQQIWAWSGDEADGFEPDVDRAWNNFQQQIRPEPKIIPLYQKLRWVAAAAILVGAFFAVRYFQGPASVKYSASEIAMTVSLEDLTTASLDPRARMEVTYGKERQVELYGSAYFEVVRDTLRPFIVRSNEVEVRVLGTGFRVDGSENGTTVRVRHGRVQVSLGDRSLELGAGDGVRVRRGSDELAPLEPDDVIRWADRLVQFHEAPMSEVLATLRGVYPVEMRLASPSMGRCRLTATFDDEPIELVLEVIAETFGWTLSSDASGAYILDGEGC
ncbi:MAG: FecR domain-containing protein [Flavobacteriales bacterium]|nr:FecR domain-containing protein [Flavobacteriales bacterium]